MWIFFKVRPPLVIHSAHDTPTVRKQPAMVNPKVSPATLRVTSIFRLTRSGSQTKVIPKERPKDGSRAAALRQAEQARRLVVERPGG